MAEKEKSKPYMLRFYPELRERIRRLAEQDRRNVSDYIRLALEDHCAAQEAKHRAQRKSRESHAN